MIIRTMKITMKMSEKYMNTREAANHCGLSSGNMSILRHTGKGPRFCKDPKNGFISYDRKDLDNYLAAKRALAQAETAFVAVQYQA